MTTTSINHYCGFRIVTNYSKDWNGWSALVKNESGIIEFATDHDNRLCDTEEDAIIEAEEWIDKMIEK